MTLNKLKSDLRMTADLILSLSLVKWHLICPAVKVLMENNYSNTLPQPYVIFAMKLLVYVNTLQAINMYYLVNLKLIH